MALIKRELRKSTNPVSIEEKKKRAQMKNKDLRKMNEDEVLEWLKLGLDIPGVLSSFRVDGKTITQMSTKDIKHFMTSENALKVTKGILKASDRDLDKFDFDYAEVLKKDDLQPIEQFFKDNPMNTESVDESIITAFGEKFEEKLKLIKDKAKKEKWAKVQKDFSLSEDELLIYVLFSKSLTGKDYSAKIFEPFISRTSAGFLKTKDFFVRLLSVLRKLPASLGESEIFVNTRKNVDDFKIGETYVFPSFARGTVFKGDPEKKEGSFTTLRISGRTKRGYIIEGVIFFGPETSFKVTKVEKGESGGIVHCEFAEDDGLSVLVDSANGQKDQSSYLTEEKGSTTTPTTTPTTITGSPSTNTQINASESDKPKFVDVFPASLSDIYKTEFNNKTLSLEEAAKKAGFTLSERFITEAKEKKLKALKRISKDFDMTEEDVMSIFIYTLENKERSPYKILNGALAKRTRENLFPFWNYIFYLLKGLRSFPRFKKENVLYRGVEMNEEAKKAYREGRTLVWTSFTSTSTEEVSAYKFTGPSGVIFEIRGKFRGYSIGSLSKYENEEEVILEPDTKFTVMMVGPDAQKPGVTRIVLDVKETKPILESELAEFRNAQEQLEIKKEKEEASKTTNGAVQVGRTPEQTAINRECPPSFVPQPNTGNSLGGMSNQSFTPETQGGMGTAMKGGDVRSGISFGASTSQCSVRGGIQSGQSGEGSAKEKPQPGCNDQEQPGQSTSLMDSPIGLLLTSGGGASSSGPNSLTPIGMAINRAFK